MAVNSNLREVVSYPWNVDSSQRSSGTNTTPTFNTSQALTLTARGGVFQLYFTSVQVPATFYQFANLSIPSLTTVPLTATLYDGTTTNSVVLALPQGNYTAYTIITMLNTQLSAAWAFYGLAGTPTFTTAYNPATGFITYAMSSAGVSATSYVILDFTASGPTYQYLCHYFGFLTPPNNLLMSAAGVTGISTQPCVLNPINYLLVRSNLKQLRSREFITTQDTVGNVLVKIPITTQPQSWINYFQLTEPVFLVDSLINSITFTLTTNLSSNAVNLQGVNWSFSFIIREVVRPDYQSIMTTTAINYHPPQESFEEERRTLMEERQRLLQRLSFYQDKLTPQPGAVLRRSKQDVLLHTTGQGGTDLQPTPTEPEQRRDDQGEPPHQG